MNCHRFVMDIVANIHQIDIEYLKTKSSSAVESANSAVRIIVAVNLSRSWNNHSLVRLPILG
jgi:hypothetical protein